MGGWVVGQSSAIEIYKVDVKFEPIVVGHN